MPELSQASWHRIESGLSKIPHNSIFPALWEWWKTALHPRSLTVVANDICVKKLNRDFGYAAEETPGFGRPYRCANAIYLHVIHMLTERQIHIQASVPNRI